MKKLSIVFLIVTLLSSCNKEEIMTTPDSIQNELSENSSRTIEEVENKEQILEILSIASGKLSELSSEQYREIADPLREELTNNGQLSSIENVPLEDIFYLYEGIISYQYLNLNANQFTMTADQALNGDDQMETFEFIFELNITEGDNGFIVDVNSFNGLYSSIVGTLQNISNTAVIPNILVSDLDLYSIQPNLARVSLYIVTGRFPPIPPAPQQFFPIPMGEVHGAQDLGWCPSNTGNIDASDFLRGHTNRYLSKQTPTQAYQSFMRIHTTSTWSKNKFFRSTNYYTYEVPFIWKDVINSCIGDNSNSQNNNAIWTSWYNKMNSLVNIPLNSAKSVDSRFVFVSTDYFAFTKQWWSGTIYSPNQHYHNGEFVYGIKI